MRLSLLTLSIIIVFLINSCKDEVSITPAIPCMEGQLSPTYQIRIKNFDNESITRIFLSNEKGDLINIKNINSEIISLEDYCDESTTYHLTTFSNAYDEVYERFYFHFKTYLNIPNHTFLNFSNPRETIFSKQTNLIVKNIESIQKIDFGANHTITQFSEIEPFKFMSFYHTLPKHKMYMQVWANNNPPRFSIYQNLPATTPEQITLDYDTLKHTQDTVILKLPEPRKWLYTIDGVLNVETYDLIEIENTFFVSSIEAEATDQITAYLPSPEFNLEGFFLYITGSFTENFEFRSTKHYKFVNEMPTQLPDREFTVSPQIMTSDSVSIEPVINADVLSLSWLNSSFESTYITWSVVGPANNLILKKPSIPEDIINDFNPHFNTFDWDISKSFVLKYFDNLYSYEEYLDSEYNENKNQYRHFLNSTEIYQGRME